MTFGLLLPLAIAASTFSTGYGKWTPRAEGMAALTDDENEYVERVYPQVEKCADQECRDRTALGIAEIINLRRTLNADFVGSAVFDALRGPCEQLDATVAAQLECFRKRDGLTFEEGMTLAGFRPAGVNAAGYSQLRIGLRKNEVEFILGGYGEEVSYSSGGGYSIGIYRWQSGRSIIVASFANDELRSRSQTGIR